MIIQVCADHNNLEVIVLKTSCTGITQSTFFYINFGLGFQFRDLPPGSTVASVAYCTIPRFSKRSYFGRQVPLASTTHGSPLAAKGGTMGEKWWPNGAWDMHPGFFYMPQICDMGPIILLPFRRKVC